MADRERGVRAVSGRIAVNSDDIEIYTDESRKKVAMTWHNLRQQTRKPADIPNYCLADYIAPKETGVKDYIGAFAVTAGIGIDARVAEFEKQHDDYNAILLKALADRLAEAFAEHLHLRVRREFWGYAADEKLDNEALIAEKYRGIRPAPGYPGLPGAHRKRPIVRAVAGAAECRHHAHRKLCDVAHRGGERLLLLASACKVFRYRQDRPGSGRRLCKAQGLEFGRSRTLACAGNKLLTQPEIDMIKRTTYFSLALLLMAGIFSTTACSEQAAPKMETGNMTELIKTDVKLGTGDVATAGRNVSVHYTGWLYDAAAPDHHGRKFDSSRDRNEPFEFPLGAGRVIAGWDQGVAGMKVGGQRTLVIPASMGYGARGAGGVIPPNAALVFDVELLGVH